MEACIPSLANPVVPYHKRRGMSIDSSFLFLTLKCEMTIFSLTKFLLRLETKALSTTTGSEGMASEGIDDTFLIKDAVAYSHLQ